MVFLKRIILVAFGMVMAACASGPPPKDYTMFRASDPRSFVVVPVVNQSEEPEAADLFLTTVAVPLAERGFYVFPTNMIKTLMEREGLSDPYLVHSAEPQRVAGLFGADAIVYIEILSWTPKYDVFATGVEVGFLYTIRDGRSGALLWQDQETYFANESSNSGNIIADLVANAIIAGINETRSDFTAAAAQANSQALLTDGQGIPRGPYSPDYKKDESKFPSSGSGRISNATQEAVAYPRLANPDEDDQVSPKKAAPVDK